MLYENSEGTGEIMRLRKPEPKVVGIDYKLNVFFPDYQLESHRSVNERNAFACLLHENGIKCAPMYLPEHELIFCGSLNVLQFTINETRNVTRDLPCIHYCWDMYPAALNLPLITAGVVSPIGWDDPLTHFWHTLWHTYKHCLTHSPGVMAPTDSCARRIANITKRDVTIIPPPVHLWQAPVKHGKKVMDVMRRYDFDPNNWAVRDACEELGLPCVLTGTKAPLDTFRREVASARLLVSSYYEASTGGLTLLEGYALGKRVLISDSKWQGAKDLFGDRAYYFKWNSREDLKKKITELYALPPKSKKEVAECKEWVENTYNDKQFADEITQFLLNTAKTCGTGKQCVNS